MPPRRRLRSRRKAVAAHQQREIDGAIEKAVRRLRSERTADGSFGSGLFSQGELGVGLTSLVGLALRNGGVARDDPAVAEARTFAHRGVVQGLPSDGSQFARIDVYSAGLAVAFLLEVGEKPDDAALVQLVTFLADSCDSEGWWGYSVWNPSALPADGDDRARAPLPRARRTSDRRRDAVRTDRRGRHRRRGRRDPARRRNGASAESHCVPPDRVEDAGAPGADAARDLAAVEACGVVEEREPQVACRIGANG